MALFMTRNPVLDGREFLYNHMVMEISSYDNPNLDAVFGALADPTRRAILAKLSQGDASVNELAQPFAMSQPAVSKHLKVLENAGLVERAIDKQRRPARLKAAPMKDAVAWLEDFKRFWTGSFDQLDDLLSELKQEEKDV
jgi:DNA-binding transcriptional ArsR family regulator